MKSLLVCALLGGLMFQEQEIPHFQGAYISGLYGGTGWFSRHADLNRDGQMDLLLPERIMLQRDKQYPVELHIPLPDLPDGAVLDVWDDRIYIKHNEGIRCIQWTEGTWLTVLDQTLDWQGRVPKNSVAMGTLPKPELGRFLHDINADNQPELIEVTESALWAYTLLDRQYELGLMAPIIPPTTLSPRTAIQLWPDVDRHFAYPVREMRANLVLEGDEAILIQRQKLPEQLMQYTVTRYALNIETGTAKPSGEVWSTQAVPNTMSLRHLNNDGILDLVGIQQELSSASALPAFIRTHSTSIDGGKSFHSVRARVFPGFIGHTWFVDVNHDGRQDRIVESPQIFDQGPRETITSMLTRKKIGHSLSVYMQGETAFDANPAYSLKFTMDLSEPPIQSGPLFNQYIRGYRVSLLGDFDGDGWNEVAVQAKENLLELFNLNSGELVGSIPLKPNMRWTVGDVNADGLSDICVSAGIDWDNIGLLLPGEKLPTTVYFSLGNQP